MNGEWRPVGVGDESHAADGRGDRIAEKRNAGFAQALQGGVEVVDFERHLAPALAGVLRSESVNAEDAAGDIVFLKIFAITFGRLDLQDVLEKFSRAGEIGDTMRRLRN